MSDTIETNGEEVVEGSAAAESTPEAQETPTTAGSNGAEVKAAESPEPPAETAPEEKKPREPSQAVLDATAQMGQAAAVSPAEAQATADRMEREALLETLSFQVPESWLSADVAERLGAMSTPALSTMLTWLSLTWWQGYEHGRVETTNALERALKTAQERGMATDKDRAAMDSVRQEIRQEQQEISASIEAGGGAGAEEGGAP